MAEPKEIWPTDEISAAVVDMTQKVSEEPDAYLHFLQLQAHHPQYTADKMKFMESIPMWALALIGSFAIGLISFGLILVIYGRFFKIYMYTAVAPLALATFGGTGTSSMGKSFLRSYASICVQGVVIVLSCIIFSAFASSGSPAIVDGSAIMKVWNYLQETFFNMALLVVMILGVNNVVKEMFGL